MVWTDDVKKMTIGKWIRKWFSGSKDSDTNNDCSYAPLFEKLVGEVLDGKAFMLYCNPAEAFYLADHGVKPVISVSRSSEPVNCLSHLVEKYNKELTVSSGTSENVDSSANIVCVRSLNPISDTFMNNFVMEKAPYEVFAADCKDLSDSHFRFVLDYARQTVSDGKYLLLKNIGDRIADVGPYWNQISSANQFMEDDYSVLLKKDSSYARVLSNEHKALHNRAEKLGRN